MSILTAIQADQIDRMTPEAQAVGLGSEVRTLGLYVPVVLTAAVTADATGGQSIAIPFAMEILDVVVQARATNGSGTAKLKSGANDITNAIAMATDKTMARAGTIDRAYSTLATTDTLTVVTNGAADRGLITIIGKRA